MLHPTNIPSCAPEMECLLDFQERLLEFACTHDKFDSAALVEAFGQNVVGWLNENNTRQRLLDQLIAIIRGGISDDKKALLEKFKHDRTYTTRVEDPSFRFELVVSETDSNFLKVVKKFLVGNYEQLKNGGFHPLICGHEHSGFTDKNWWEGFRSANPGIRTCSVCDASLSAGGETIEHYFPKGQYPALSTHPSNLIPLCKTCNNEIKKEKDPLEADPISAIYLPYRHHVRNDIRLDFQDDGRGGYKVQVAPANDDVTTRKRVEKFENMFELSRRWSKALGEISETAESRARSYIDTMRELGKPINVQTIPGYVEAACRQMEKYWGRSNYEYIATQWLRWAKDNKPALITSLAT